jgi:hypothetical protein
MLSLGLAPAGCIVSGLNHSAFVLTGLYFCLSELNPIKALVVISHKKGYVPNGTIFPI